MLFLSGLYIVPHIVTIIIIIIIILSLFKFIYVLCTKSCTGILIVISVSLKCYIPRKLGNNSVENEWTRRSNEWTLTRYLYFPGNVNAITAVAEQIGTIPILKTVAR